MTTRDLCLAAVAASVMACSSTPSSPSSAPSTIQPSGLVNPLNGLIDTGIVIDGTVTDPGDQVILEAIDLASDHLQSMGAFRLRLLGITRFASRTAFVDSLLREYLATLRPTEIPEYVIVYSTQATLLQPAGGYAATRAYADYAPTQTYANEFRHLGDGATNLMFLNVNDLNREISDIATNRANGCERRPDFQTSSDCNLPQRLRYILIHELMHSFGPNGIDDHFDGVRCLAAFPDRFFFSASARRLIPITEQELAHAGMCPDVWDRFRSSRRTN